MRRKIEKPQVQVKKEPPKNQFDDLIQVVNTYNALLKQDYFSGLIDNETVVSELTEFVENRLSQLINLNTEKKEAFEPNEVRILKNLLKKVDSVPQKTVQVQVTNAETQVVVERPKELVPPVATFNQDNVDPLVKEFVQEHKIEEESKPRKHKLVVPEGYQRPTVADINAYAMNQASAAEQKFKQNKTVEVKHNPLY